MLSWDHNQALTWFQVHGCMPGRESIWSRIAALRLRTRCRGEVLVHGWFGAMVVRTSSM